MAQKNACSGGEDPDTGATMDKSIFFMVSVAALSASTGCVGTRVMGISQVPVAAGERTPMVCLEKEGGDHATLVEGDVGGRPGISIEGKSGFAPTLIDAVPAEGGATYYVGQSCEMQSSPACVNALALRTGNQRVYITWNEVYPAQAMLPASPVGMVEQWRATPLHGVLFREMDFDPPTLAAFVTLSDSRRDAARLKAGIAVAGAALAFAGAASGKGGKQAAALGKAMVKTGGAVGVIVMSDEDKALIVRTPRMAPAFQTLSFLGEGATFCYGRAAGGPPPPPPR
jgi:hypothetical protein